MEVGTVTSKKHQLHEEGNESSVQSHHGSDVSYLGATIASPMAKRVLQMNDADDDHHIHHPKKTRSCNQNDEIQHETSDTIPNARGSSSPASAMAEVKQPPQRRPQHIYQVRSLTALYRDNRRTNDEIHGTINLGPVVTCLLDTPPMQRLRYLKQLGCAEFVYMNVNHNRFEHSLGVAELAEKLCRKISLQQPSLKCTEKDVLCVRLAGLLHDIGHGPFSHSYESFVMVDFPTFLAKNPTAQTLYQESNWPVVPKNWTHESASLMMIDAALAFLGLAIDVNNLDQPLKQIGNGIDARSMRSKPDVTSQHFGNQVDHASPDDDDSSILTSRDWIFVKECIWGKPIPDIEAILGPGFHGRTGEHQDWLYDIVANRHSGLDVDKIDYYARDRRRALGEAGEIDKVFIEEAIVAWAPCTHPKTCFRCQHHKASSSSNKTADKIGNKHLMICYPDKLIGASMNFFKTRFELHSIIYKHKTNVGVAYMISDILCLADPHLQVSTAPFHATAGNGASGIAKTEYESLPLSRAMLHPMSYLRLRDSVIDLIEASTCPELEPARKLVQRLGSRDLYKCVATKVLKTHKVANDRRIWELSPSGIVKDIVDFKAQHDDGHGGMIQLVEHDVIVDKCQIHHGQKHQDPLSKMRFVEKSQLNKISTNNYKDLPEAKVVNDDEYDSFLPRTLMECSLRIYCRDKSKVDLLRHTFELWWDSIHEEMKVTEEPKMQNGNKAEWYQENHEVAILSQETDDEDDDQSQIMNPVKYNFGGDDDRTSYPPWCSPNTENL